MSTTTWNQEQEVLIASAELGDSTGRDAVALLVAARKRAFDAEQHIRQLAPAKPWDDAREFQRLAGEVAAIDRKDSVALIRELHHMILSARKVAFWADERAYALKLEIETLKADRKWISPSERMPELHTEVLGIDDSGDVELVECVPCFQGGTEWKCSNGRHGKVWSVSGWMPLPERSR